jgi:acyl-CoA dehydrogenase
MNFDFSDEQEELRRHARRLLGKGMAAARAALESGASHDHALWRQVIDMGWPAAAVPEAQGGLGLGPLELCVLAEEFGRTLAPVPFSSSVLQASEALKLGLPAQPADDWLAMLAGGAGIGTVALCEPGAPQWTSMPAARVAAGFMHGTKHMVADGMAADVAIVSARSDQDGDGFGWWIVDLRQPQVRRSRVEAIDCVRGTASLVFDSAPALRLGQPGQGMAMAQALLDRCAVFDAFEQLGGAEALLALTLDYVKTRQAFGRPVGGYQAVKHRLADMYVKIQLARSHAYYGAWAVLNDAPELAQCAAGARIAAIDAFRFAAEEAIELHGGIGFTWESDCQLFYRRARLLAVSLGGRPYWSKRLAGALLAARS